MFQSLSEKLSNAFKFFKNKGKLTEADVKAGMREIKMALLEADVNFKVVKDFVKMVSERAVGAEVMESLLPAQQIVKIVNEELIKLMGTSQAKLSIAPKPPTVIMRAKPRTQASWQACIKSRAKSRFWSPVTCTAPLRLNSWKSWGKNWIFRSSRWGIKKSRSRSPKRA